MPGRRYSYHEIRPATAPIIEDRSPEVSEELTQSRTRGLNLGSKLYHVFKPRRRVVLIETRVRSGRQQRLERAPSPRPSRGRILRTPSPHRRTLSVSRRRHRNMSPAPTEEGAGYVPLPPVLPEKTKDKKKSKSDKKGNKKKSSHDSDSESDGDSVIFIDRSPNDYSPKSHRSLKTKFIHPLAEGNHEYVVPHGQSSVRHESRPRFEERVPRHIPQDKYDKVKLEKRKLQEKLQETEATATHNYNEAHLQRRSREMQESHISQLEQRLHDFSFSDRLQREEIQRLQNEILEKERQTRDGQIAHRQWQEISRVQSQSRRPRAVLDPRLQAAPAIVSGNPSVDAIREARQEYKRAYESVGNAVQPLQPLRSRTHRRGRSHEIADDDSLRRGYRHR